MRNLFTLFLLLTLISGWMLAGLDGQNSCLAQNAVGTQNPAMQAKTSVSERFQQTLNALAKRWKITIIAEGQPIITHSDFVLPTPEVIANSSDLYKENILRGCAAYFDYEMLPEKEATRKGKVYL